MSVLWLYEENVVACGCIIDGDACSGSCGLSGYSKNVSVVAGMMVSNKQDMFCEQMPST